MKIGPTAIDDTFAEAFGMKYSRLIITAHDTHWLDAALREFTGFASSVIACDLEVGREIWLPPTATPDGRPGAAVLCFGFSQDALGKAIPLRTGQCLMTCPSTAVYDGLPETQRRIALGKQLRFFGDGFQKSKQVAGQRYWRIPVMDGEFLVQEQVGVDSGVAGGNIILQATSLPIALEAARRTITALDELEGIITPFPGGVARSGSKVGSRYKNLKASTAEAFCPTLRGRVDTKLHEGVNAVLEIVIDGISEEAVARAMSVALQTAAGEGVLAISAGNYGGKLGKYHFHLHQLAPMSRHATIKE